ncbi:MAG: hypothetical protein CML55_02250 [Rhodobacteraceae bacterium]|nr:hypothetical protein [Paracoccaceae bacterium]
MSVTQRQMRSLMVRWRKCDADNFPFTSRDTRKETRKDTQGTHLIGTGTASPDFRQNRPPCFRVSEDTSAGEQ